MKKLPKQIYVTLEKDGDETFLLAADNVDDVNPGQSTGIYELIELGTVASKSEFLKN